MWRGNVQKAMLILAAALAAFLSVGGVSDDAEIRGRVVRVADGDTITILESVGSRVPVLRSLGEGGPRDRASPAAIQHKIRLCGIDAVRCMIRMAGIYILPFKQKVGKRVISSIRCLENSKRKEVNKMDSRKMLAVLGAMSVAAAVVPAVTASADSKKDSGQEGLVLYTGAQAQGQSVTWHSSHGSHTSHSSHSSSRW